MDDAQQAALRAIEAKWTTLPPKENTMLDALLATIGVLGLLATIAVKFGKSCTEAMARHAERREDPPDTGPAPAAKRVCPHRRRRRKAAAGR